MKIRDEEKWAEQCQEWDNDYDPDNPDRSKRFKEFLVAWADLAEEWLDNRPARTLLRTPLDALRATLRQAEQDTSRHTIGFIGQALLVFTAHWSVIADEADFLTSMTPIEQNLLMDTIALWYVINLSTESQP